MSIVQDAQRFPITAVMIVGAVAAVLAEASGRSVEHLMLLPGTALSEPWRLVTCVLPHGGPLHLVFNVYWIWMLGRVIEARLGSPRTAALSVAAALSASGLEAAMGHNAVGLSGIVYGFAFFVYARGRHDPRFFGIMDARLIRFFIGWFFLCVALTELDLMRVANAAHFGGGLMGFAAGLRKRWAAPAVLAAVLALLVVAPSRGGSPQLVRLTADRHLQDGRAAEALVGYQELIRAGDVRAGTWKNYGIALEREGRIPEALQAWREAIAIDPQVFTPEERQGVQAEIDRVLGPSGDRAAPSPR